MKRVLRRGFTLMEIVLAIALTSVVMYLLMTAIELYMVRVDSSRGRVESAQLARTLLDGIAADLTATRLYAPPSPAAGGAAGGAGARGGGSSASGGAPAGGAPSGGGATGGGQPGGAAGGPSAAGGGSNGGAPSGGFASGGGGTGGSPGGAAAAPLPSDVQGVFGEVEQLRIDRAALPNWQRAARDVLPEEPVSAADLPATVRYFLGDGQRMTTEQLALRGVPEDGTTASAAGLYRELVPTAALAGQSDPLSSPTDRDGATLELLAPEVVKIEFAYFDGTNLAETWDSFDEGGLPAGVEIRLTLYEPSFQRSLEADEPAPAAGQPRYRENELVEYRRFVRLPSISPPQPADALLPAPGGGAVQPGGQPGAAGGNNGRGEGGPNGGPGGPDNGSNRGQGGGNDD